MTENQPSKPMLGVERVVVTSTGFPAAERRALKFRVQQLGITYSGDLVAGNGGTTHLLCYRLLDAFGSPKYNCALAWGVRVLSYKWIYDSSIAGRLLPVGEYKTDSAVPDDSLLAADVSNSQNVEDKLLLQQQQHIPQHTDHQMAKVHISSALTAGNLPEPRLALSALPSNFVRASQQQTGNKIPNSEVISPCGAHPANFHEQPLKELAPRLPSHDAFTFSTPARHLKTSQPSLPSQEIPSPSFANLGTAPVSIAFNAGPFHNSSLLGTPAISVQEPFSSNVSAQNNLQASETEKWRLQPHIQLKGCLAQCLTSQLPTAVQTSLDRLQLGRQSKADTSIRSGSSAHHPASIDDIIPATPGAEFDSWQNGVIVPGTQCQDDDDEDLSTPQSLIQYLRSTLSSGVTSSSVKHETGECEHQLSHSSGAGSVLSFALHTHRQEREGSQPGSEPGSPSLSFGVHAHSAHTASPMAMSPLPVNSPASPMQSSPFPSVYQSSPMACSPAPFISHIASSLAFFPSLSFPPAAAATSPSHPSPVSPMVVSPPPCTSPHTAYSDGTIDLVTPLPSYEIQGQESVICQARAVTCATTMAASQQHNNISNRVSEHQVQGHASSVHQGRLSGPLLTRFQEDVDPLSTHIQRVLKDETPTQEQDRHQSPKQQSSDSRSVDQSWDPKRQSLDTAAASQVREATSHRTGASAGHQHGLRVGTPLQASALTVPTSSAYSSSNNIHNRPLHGSEVPSLAATCAHAPAALQKPQEQYAQEQGMLTAAQKSEPVAAGAASAVTANRIGRRLVRNSTIPVETNHQNVRQTGAGSANGGSVQQQQIEDDAEMRELEDDMSDCGENRDVFTKSTDFTKITGSALNCAEAAEGVVGDRRTEQGGPEDESFAIVGGLERNAMNGVHARAEAAGLFTVSKTAFLRGDASNQTRPALGPVQGRPNLHSNIAHAGSAGSTVVSHDGLMSHGAPLAANALTQSIKLFSNAHNRIALSKPPTHGNPVQQHSISNLQVCEVLGVGGHVTVRSRSGKDTPCKPDASALETCCASLAAPGYGDVLSILPCCPDPSPQAVQAPSKVANEVAYSSVVVKQEAREAPRQAQTNSSLYKVHSVVPVRNSSTIAALVARVTAASGSSSSLVTSAAVKIKAERTSITPEAAGQGSVTGPVNGAETIARVLGGRTAVLTPLDPTMSLAITPINPGAEECPEEAADSPCSTFDSRRHSPDQKQQATDGDETEEEEDFASLNAQSAASASGQHEGLSMYLRKMLLAARSKPGHGSGYTITVIKGLSRPTRSNTVREVHTGVSIKTVEFAEQIQIESMQLLINCRDRSRRTHCPIVILKDSISGDARAAVMEPYALYRLQSGEWWVEGYRFYTAADIQTLATACSTTLHLPCDFHRKHELLRDTDRLHARLADVIGELAVMRTKKLPSKWARGERPAFCRYVFDSTVKMVMTDQPATDFLIGA